MKPNQPNSEPERPAIFLVIPCAGSGSRAGTALAKQYQLLLGKPMVQYTLDAFTAVKRIRSGVVVVAPGDDYFEQHPAVTDRFQIAKVGGASRADSVIAGLGELVKLGAVDSDWVLVHDAARCLILPAQIDTLIDACAADAVGGILALPMVDTLKQVQADSSVTTLERSDKWLAQTPQMFKLGLLRSALTLAGSKVTDEASAMEQAGHTPKLITGSVRNIKITYPADFALAHLYLEQDLQSKNMLPASNGLKAMNKTTNQTLAHLDDAVTTPQKTMAPPDDAARTPQQTMETEELKKPTLPALRIGQGWDVHQLVDSASTGRQLILGGVTIPFDKGLLGHSDADVLLHAITDALLGAAGLGDIGRHFPDTDAKYQGADSKLLLQTVVELVRAKGYAIANLDATIIAQAPKLAPYMAQITQSVADCLALPLAQVNIKAKTAEKLGPVGEGKSIEAQAVVLLFVCSH